MDDAQRSDPETPPAPPGAAPAPVDTRALRRALGQFATGVTIVTCRAPDGALVGMTANSFSSVSLDPPLVLWSLDKRARSYEAFAGAEAFAFSVLGVDQIDLSNRFAGRGLGPGDDKFAGLDWTPGLAGVPLIPDAAATFECRLERTVEAGDHLIILGRVERFARYAHSVLVFAEGRYGTVAPHPMEREAVEDGIFASPDDGLLLPLLYRVYAKLFRDFSGGLAERGTSEAQMRLLAILAAAGPTGRDGLQRATLLSDARMEAACQELAARGDILDGPRCEITPEGRARLGDLTALALEHERAGTRSLDEAEVLSLRRLLQKLLQSAP
ncbi:MAG: flavin reductase family protein [Pseudomonadota bacterium]